MTRNTIAILILTLAALVHGAAADAAPVKPVVVLAHGYNQSPASMAPLADRFRADGFVVYNLDLPSNDNLKNARYICDFLSQNNLTDVAFIGHSMGGLSGRYCATQLGGLSRFDYIGLLDTPNYGTRSWFECWLIPTMCSTSTFIRTLNAPADLTPEGPFWHDVRFEPSAALPGACVYDLPGKYSLSAHMALPGREDVYQVMRAAIDTRSC